MEYRDQAAALRDARERNRALEKDNESLRYEVACWRGR